MTYAAPIGVPLLCVPPPPPPRVPADAEQLAEFRDVIIADFEAYMRAVPKYFACLDRERDRALLEVRNVGESYADFQQRMPR